MNAVVKTHELCSSSCMSHNKKIELTEQLTGDIMC